METIRLKYCAEKRNSYPIGDGDHGQIKPNMYQDSGIPYIRVQNLGYTEYINFDDVVYINEKVHNDNLKSELIPGDILIAKTGATVGKIGIIPDDVKKANTTSSVGKITIDKSRFYNKFIYYCLASDIIQDTIKVIAFEKSAQPGFNIDDIKNFRVANLPFEKQKEIADFLDKKVGAINRIIDCLENQIVELEKYSNKTITHSVTYGIGKSNYKTVDLKWIKEIPNNWSLGIIKADFNLRGRIGWQGLTTADYKDEGPYLITGTDFDNGIVNWDTCVHITEKRYNEDSNIHVKEGDLLITKDGTIGKLSVVTNAPEKVSLNSGIMLIKPKTAKCKTGYLKYVLQSNIFWDWYNFTQRGNATIKHLYQEQFAYFKYPLPSIEEQDEIIKYLDKKCSQILHLISLKKQRIEELKNYKKSLIYEHIIGKREVK